jgi:Putative DNA-binding domain
VVQRSLHQIHETDLQALIDNGVPEKKTIEYKSALPGRTDQDKKEFLADVSSFANTSGGDLIFGMEEDSGKPTKLVGIATNDLGIEKERLENLIRAGLDPRIRYDLAEVICAPGSIVIVRIEQSWVRPHRVILGGHDKFYGRNSTGKYPLDVGELRAAFTASESLYERIRAFRTDRIIAVSNEDTPVPFSAGAKIVLHCVPLQSFGNRPPVDLQWLLSYQAGIQSVLGTFKRSRMNLDGALVYGGDATSTESYLQVFRNGVIEFVDGEILRGTKDIPSGRYEKNIIAHLADCLHVLQKLSIGAPVALMLSFTKMLGRKMLARNRAWDDDGGCPITSQTITLPEVILEDLHISPATMLRPLFDMIWNACGHPRSPNFDIDGNWTVGRY